MIIRTEYCKGIMDYLKTDPIINLNIMGIIENVHEAEIYVDDKNNPKGIFVRNGYMHYIYTKEDVFLNEVLDTFMKNGFYGFSGVEASIANKIWSRFQPTWESPCTLYYLPEENLDVNLIKNPVTTVDIKDAETIDKYYQFRSPTSLARIRNDIKMRPSSAIYVDDEIACWVLVHEDNSMGIMYTKEEYRRRGYAVDVTIDLAFKIIKSGKIPYLQIIKENNMSTGLAKKCGFIPCGYVEWFGIKA